MALQRVWLSFATLWSGSKNSLVIFRLLPRAINQLASTRDASCFCPMTAVPSCTDLSSMYSTCASHEIGPVRRPPNRANALLFPADLLLRLAAAPTRYRESTHINCPLYCLPLSVLEEPPVPSLRANCASQWPRSQPNSTPLSDVVMLMPVAV